MNEEGNSRIVNILGLISGFSSFTMGIILTDSILKISSLGQTIHWLATLRLVGEVFGYFARILAGFIIDKSRKSLRLLLLVGYTASVVLKFLFFISMLDGLLSVPTRCILFSVANIIDKTFNIWRDIPRDIVIVESVPESQLQSKIVLRKAMSNLGTAFGGLVTLILHHIEKIYPVFADYKFYCIYGIALGCSVLYLIPLYKTKDIYAKIIVKNEESKKNAKYDLFDSWGVFLFLILITLLLFLGKANELYIFNIIPKGFYSTEVLYILFYFLSPLSLLINNVYKVKTLVHLLAFSGLLLIILASLFIYSINLFTVLLLCFGYSIYNSILDSVVISLFVKRFANAKYNAILLAICNFFMGIGSLGAISLLNYAQTLYPNSHSLIFSLIPISIGILLLVLLERKFQLYEI